MEKPEDVRREIAATRERMAATAVEIESRIQTRVDAVTQKLDVADHVRAHPWPALATAMVVGAAIAASDSDRKAAAAAARAAKRAPRATVDALKASASGAAHLAGAAVSRIRGGHDDDDPEHDANSGVLGRVRARFLEQARELGEHLGRAADELVRSSGAPRSKGDGTAPQYAHAGDSGIGITRPYPPGTAD